MRFTVDQAAFAKALHIACKVANSEARGSIGSAVLLEARDGFVDVSARWGASTFTTPVPAQVDQLGAVGFQAAPLRDVVDQLGAGPVQIAADIRNFQCGDVRRGGYHARILLFRAEDFPPPLTVGCTRSLELPASDLATVLDRAAFAASHDESRPKLCAVHFRADGDGVEVFATDGSRLALDKVKAQIAGRFAIVRRAIAIVRSMIDGQVGPVRITTDRAYVRVQCGDAVLTCDVVESTVDLSKMLAIRTDEDVTMVAPQEALLSMIARVKRCASQGFVAIAVTPGSCRMSSSNVDGEASDEINVTATGSCEVKCNVGLIKDAVERLDSDAVRLRFTGRVSPIFLTSDAAPHAVHLVMPANL